jgi:phage shock protein PspC (stress-responsive transcriptional regulator)
MADIPSTGFLIETRSYAAFIGVAFAGSFLRASRWRDEETKQIVWFRVMTEIPIAIAVGAIAVGIGEYYKLDPRIVGGICGLLGLLGPAFFTSAGDALLDVLKNRFSK